MGKRNVKLIDAYGAIDENIKDLLEAKAKLAAEIKDIYGPGTHEGDAWTLAVVARENWVVAPEKAIRKLTKAALARVAKVSLPALRKEIGDAAYNLAEYTGNTLCLKVARKED